MIFNNETASIVNSLVGEFEIIKDHRDKSNRTGVTEIKTIDGNLFVKTYNRLSRWNPEVYAYQNWTHIFGDKAPILIDYFNNGKVYGIITTPILGRTVNEYQLKDEKVLELIYYKAGEALKELHNSVKGTFFGIPSINGEPLDNNKLTNPVQYVNKALEDLFKIGYDKGLLNTRDKELVEWCLKYSDVFKNSIPVPTNWDFSQNNWMVDDSGKFTGFIDFENMLWGIDVDSFGVVIERYTPHRPKLLKALFDGYGLEDNIERQLQIKIISVKMAVADIVYGTDIGDNRLFSLGRNLLNKIK